MPEGVEVAIGYSYLRSCVAGCNMFHCSAVCIAYDGFEQRRSLPRRPCLAYDRAFSTLHCFTGQTQTRFRLLYNILKRVLWASCPINLFTANRRRCRINQHSLLHHSLSWDNGYDALHPDMYTPRVPHRLVRCRVWWYDPHRPFPAPTMTSTHFACVSQPSNLATTRFFHGASPHLVS